MQQNIIAVQQRKRNLQLCKLLSICLVALMLISSVSLCASAATTAWGMQSSQVNSGYFYSIGYGGNANPYWSIIRQRCFLNCKTLVNTYNMYVVDTNIEFNMVKELDYCYKNGYANDAVSIANRWNTIYAHIVDAVNDTGQLCGFGNNPQKVNNKDVTVDQYQNLYDQISAQYNELNDISSEIRALYSMAKFESEDQIGNVLSDSAGLVNLLWTTLRNAIYFFGTGTGSSNSFLGISISSDSIKQIADAVSAIIKTFAYAVAVLLFGVNITTTALQNEILTLRGGIKIFARVLLVKIWIDIAIPICIYIMNIINTLARQILLNISVSSGSLFKFKINTSESHGVFDKILGAIRMTLDWMIKVISASPAILLLLIMAICIIIVMVKLVARGFELTCLVSLSPVFFATLVGEESKRYFRRFISAFLSTAGYILFIAIVYAVGTRWVAECSAPILTFDFNSAIKFVESNLPRAIIIIACCRVCVKPPKVLTSLFDG